MDKAIGSQIGIEAIQRRFLGVVWLLSLVIAAANILTEGLIPVSRESLYIFEMATVVCCLLIWPKVSLNTTLILLITALTLSNAVNNPLPDFRSWVRLAFFTMMLVFLSPLVDNNGLKAIRQNLWKWTVLFIKIEIILEFFLYIPWIIENYDNNGGYMGLVGHHMLHALIAAFATTVFLWELIAGKCKNRALGIVLFIMSVVVLVACGSRCAIMGFAAAVIPLILSLRKYRIAMAIAFASVAVLVALIFFIPNPLTKTLRFKFSLNEKYNSLTFSRDELWQARWSEFRESPLLGIGFCANTYHSERFDKPNANGIYISEPGSAWLSLLANGGILALGIFVWFNISLLRHLFLCLKKNTSKSPLPTNVHTQQTTTPNNAKLPLLYFSLWLLFIVHGFFEGWVLYAGSLVFSFYWLLTSQITHLPHANPTSPIPNN